MSVKPILFNTEMVRAILGGRKSVTRRVVKRKGYEEKIHNPKNDYAYNRKDGNWEIGYDKRPIRGWPQGAVAVREPYRPGDILYVRETWSRFDCSFCEGDAVTGKCLKAPDARGGCYMYRATDEITGDARWRPSIHMPREAARIWLRVTDVRVERLREISSEDAWNEGAISKKGFGSTRKAFIETWDSTIKPADRERYGWAANPFCWVISFERISKDEAMQQMPRD